MLTTLQRSCNCVVVMMATHYTVKLQLYTWKNKFIKFSLHGSRFVKHIFSNNREQTDLESELRLGDIAFFWSESRKDSLYTCFLVGGGGMNCGWLPACNFACMRWTSRYMRPMEGLCICYSKCTLLHFSLVVQTHTHTHILYIYIYMYIYIYIYS